MLEKRAENLVDQDNMGLGDTVGSVASIQAAAEPRSPRRGFAYL